MNLESKQKKSWKYTFTQALEKKMQKRWQTYFSELLAKQGEVYPELEDITTN